MIDDPIHTGHISADALAGNHVDNVVLPVETTHRQGYRIGALRLLIKFDEATELMELPTIYRVPGAVRDIHGIANLHGNVVPVFSLHDKLGQASEGRRSISEKSMLLVLGKRDRMAGVLIDGLPVRKRFLPEEACALNDIPDVMKNYASAAWRQSDGIWIDFDCASLLSELAFSHQH